MTEQEALKYIKLFREEWDRNSKTKNAEALDVAIKALEDQITIKSLGECYIIPKNSPWEINGVDIIKAVEKQMPKQVKLYIGQDMQCPECNKRLRNYEGMKICYCKFCGQVLER